MKNSFDNLLASFKDNNDENMCYKINVNFIRKNILSL